MAYLTKEKTIEVRNALKSAFPEIKFSVRNADRSSLEVAIMAAPYDFFAGEDAERLERNGYQGINHYHFMRDPNILEKAIIDKIVRICNIGNYDNSRIEIDYFDCGYYFNLKVGKWDKPFVKTEKKDK